MTITFYRQKENGEKIEMFYTVSEDIPRQGEGLEVGEERYIVDGVDRCYECSGGNYLELSEIKVLLTKKYNNEKVSENSNSLPS